MASEKESYTHTTSNANDLTERLRRRLETERQAIEELTASELGRLGANSQRVASNALRIIEADTAVATGRMRVVQFSTPAGGEAARLRRTAGEWRIAIAGFGGRVTGGT